MKGNTERSVGVQSVERALSVLETVGRNGPMGVTEIARAVGLHVATVHNLLRTLAGRYYLLNEGGRYRLGPAAAVLAGRFEPLQALPELVGPHLRKMSEETGEAASATILVGTEAHLVGFHPGTQPVTIHFPQYCWPDPRELATGRLLLAMSDVVSPNADDRPRMEPAAVQRIREEGYSLLCRPAQGHQLALAVPVWSAGGKVIASIGLSCPGFRATLAHVRAMSESLWDATMVLSEVLGYDGPPQKKPHIRSLQGYKSIAKTVRRGSAETDMAISSRGAH